MVYILLTESEIKLKIKELTNNEYELISSYKNYSTKVTIKHLKCEKNFEVKPSNFLSNNTRCPHCRNLSRKIYNWNTEYYKKLVKEIYDEEYSILGNYVNKVTKILTRHNTCGYIWEIDPFHFINERNRCPLCNKIAREESKNVIMIEEILKELSITYEREKKLFKNPSTKLYLRADFFIEKFNLVIEYDGKQHFKPMFNDNTKLEKTIERDNLKNSWLIKNRINYIRIPYNIYKKEDIKNILIYFFKAISSEASNESLLEERSTTIQLDNIKNVRYNIVNRLESSDSKR